MRLEACNFPLNITLDVRDQFLDSLRIGFLDKLRPPEASFSIGRLLRQNMPGKRLLGLYLPRPGLLKSLGRSSIGFQFWHVILLLKKC